MNLVDQYAKKISLEIEGSLWDGGDGVSFEYRGLECRIRVGQPYILYGYIRVPRDFLLEEKVSLLKVHGGITYCNDDEIGFDCGHYEDMSPRHVLYHPSTKEPSIEEVLIGLRSLNTEEVSMKESDFVLKELKHLADQILDILGRVLQVKRLNEKGRLPLRTTPQSAGYDLFSSVDLDIPGRSTGVVSTGISITVPEGHYGRIAPRSGLALRHQIDVGGGVIDADYRGEIKAILFNHSSETFHVSSGDRIAQLILERISTPEILEVKTLSETSRGTAGFGSTGTR